MYLFWYLSWALSAQFISVYLLGKGFSAAQVALVVSCPQHLPIPDLLVQVAQEFDSE
jgi:hypothetical protein